MEPVEKLPTVSFVADAETREITTVIFHPNDHENYLQGTTLPGHGTSIIGGRGRPPPEPAKLGDTVKLGEGE